MSHPGQPLLAVYIDGETKTGKGSASLAIAEVLQSHGERVYYDVAGDFYRRYVAMVRRYLGLGEDDALPTGSILEQAARALRDSGQAFRQDETLGDLQRASVARSVSVMAELELVQAAGVQWWGETIRAAKAAHASVLVVDGRNPRARVADVTAGYPTVQTALELYMLCDPAEAAQRVLLAEGREPTSELLEAMRLNIADRRARDRSREHTPFIVPTVTVDFSPDSIAAAEAVRQSWVPREHAPAPMTITLDNSYITKATMHAAVSGLAIAAVQTAAERHGAAARLATEANV